MNPTPPPLPVEPATLQPAASRARRVHVVDADPATFELIREWLVPEGWQVLEFDACNAGTADDAPSLAIVDLGFARHVGDARGAGDPSGAADARGAVVPALVRVRDALPGVPLLVMSPTIFDGVGCCGPCARQLGVAGVLPKPSSREALIAAVTNLTRPAA